MNASPGGTDRDEHTAAKPQEFSDLLDAARERMRVAATARCPVVSADDIHIVLAALASAQAALRDLREHRRVAP